MRKIDKILQKLTNQGGAGSSGGSLKETGNRVGCFRQRLRRGAAKPAYD